MRGRRWNLGGVITNRTRAWKPFNPVMPFKHGSWHDSYECIAIARSGLPCTYFYKYRANMTETEELAKDLEERGLERQGLMNLWQRQWRPVLALSLKAAQADLIAIHESYRRRIKARNVNESAPCGEEESMLVKCSAEIHKQLSQTNEHIFRLALHPLPPKAVTGTKGGRPRSSDPIAEATLVAPGPMPVPKPVTPE